MTMNVEFYFRKKIPVAILGPTGLVGQKFIQILSDHPWFTIEALAGSKNSIGKKYGDVVDWSMSCDLPKDIADLKLLDLSADIPVTIAFSALDSSVAGEAEEQLARKGIGIISNARNHRMDPLVPLIVPEINSNHLKIIEQQPYSEKGFIVTNPNCVVIGLSLALKPLVDQFGVESVQVATMQAVSGAGKNQELTLLIDDNIIPFIAEEEDKVEKEPKKILGTFDGKQINEYSLQTSAQCNRVPVSDGHLLNVAVKLKKSAAKQELIHAWTSFSGEPQGLDLPNAPIHPIHYFHQDDFPQTKKHRDIEKGMAISIGGLRKCPNFGDKFSVLSHNTIRGAAGNAVLIAELMVKNYLIYW